MQRLPLIPLLIRVRHDINADALIGGKGDSNTRPRRRARPKDAIHDRVEGSKVGEGREVNIDVGYVRYV